MRIWISPPAVSANRLATFATGPTSCGSKMPQFFVRQKMGLDYPIHEISQENNFHVLSSPSSYHWLVTVSFSFCWRHLNVLNHFSQAVVNHPQLYQHSLCWFSATFLGFSCQTLRFLCGVPVWTLKFPAEFSSRKSKVGAAVGEVLVAKSFDKYPGLVRRGQQRDGNAMSSWTWNMM